MRLPCNEATYDRFVSPDDVIEINAGIELQAGEALAAERLRLAKANATMNLPVWTNVAQLPVLSAEAQLRQRVLDMMSGNDAARRKRVAVRSLELYNAWIGMTRR